MIVFDVDNLIYYNEEEKIMNEIIDKKEWTNREVDSLFKFPNSKIMNITFKQSTLAKNSEQWTPIFFYEYTSK